MPRPKISNTIPINKKQTNRIRDCLWLLVSSKLIVFMLLMILNDALNFKKLNVEVFLNTK